MKFKIRHIILGLQHLFVCILFLFSTNVYCQLSAKFSASNGGGCAPILVQFTDLSTGNPTQWKWDLGNGTISYLQHPSVTYFSPGTYTVKLIISSANNSDSVIKTGFIKVESPPIADFSSDLVSGCNSLQVKFSDRSNTQNSSNVSWQWDLGDGTLSDEKNPVHIYDIIGSYNVTLKVTNSNGCSAVSRKENYIHLDGIKAGFSNVVSTKCFPTKISFKNTSAGNGDISYKWFFGDGAVSSLKDTAHTYSDGGVYPVKLIAMGNNGCTDTVVQSITVSPLVSAKFTSDKQSGCVAPFNVHFAGQQVPGNTFLWSFGDSTTSNLQSPEHLYSDTGLFTVKLIVTNAKGCVDSVKQTDYIKVGKQSIYFSNLPDSSCAGFTKNFMLSENRGDSIVSYQWNFGDGQYSAKALPAHVYNTAGHYDISLITVSTNGCRDTISALNGIHIGKKPKAGFIADQKNVCGSVGVSFTDISSGDPSNWEWDFGDGEYSFEQSPKHYFKDTGYSTVSLIAMNGGCTDTARFKNYVYVKAPVAKYKVNLDCRNPLSVGFVNNSIGADEWQWDFGDGNHSAEYNPVHEYKESGLYTVKLSLVNHTTGCDYVKVKEIKILKSASSFFASDSVICRGNSVLFKANTEMDSVSRYIWNFGDGTNLSVLHDSISHEYKTSGIFTVRLVTQNDINCRDTIVKNMYIKVNGPTAKFGVTNVGNCVNREVVFKDSSVSDGRNAIQSWIWNYGDGGLDTLQAPPFQHKYLSINHYNPGLKLTDAAGCTDSFKLSRPVTIAKPTAWFLGYDTVVCPGMPFHFVCPFAEYGYTYKWDFGDGNTATTQYASNIYSQPGIYNVKVTVSNGDGCMDSVTIKNIAKAIQPVSKYTISDSFSTCPPLAVHFSDSSSNAVSRVWDFGDGTTTTSQNPSHFYTLPGTYITRLTVTGAGGCSHQTEKKITILGPKGTLDYDNIKICKSRKVNFTAHTSEAVSYIWDFNDGSTIIGTDSIVSHTYINPGNFIPKIILVDKIGCKVPVAGKSVIEAVAVRANFSFPNIKCDTGRVSFTDSSVATNDQITTYNWDFGDGSFSTSKNPVHKYRKEGTYLPGLTVLSETGCMDSVLAVVPVKIEYAPDVVVNASPNGCVPLQVKMNADLVTGDASSVVWKWSLGDDKIIKSQNPPVQTFSAAGIYQIQLTATGKNGCERIIGKTIEAYGTPVVRTGKDSTICKGTPVILRASGAEKYSWSPAEKLSCTDCQTVLSVPDFSTSYIVTGENSNGCFSSDTVTITVSQPPKLKYNNTESICKGQSKRLSASGVTGYSWYPSTGLSDTKSANPVAQPDTSTNYRVIGTDEKGCSSDTGYVMVNVFDYPSVDAGIDKTIAAGSSAELVPKVSDDVTEVNWYPTDGIFRNTSSGITVKPTETTEYTVEVKNRGGCLSKDRVQVFVISDGSNVFIPNTFSPNGDGSNEIFYPRGNGIFKIKNLRVFNRWGEVVFQKENFNANDPSNGWMVLTGGKN